MRAGTSSGKCRNELALTQQWSRKLSKRQPRMVMDIFNDFRQLTPQEKIDVMPILSLVLHIAFIGSFRVIEYLKDRGKRLTLPPMLRERRRSAVYLKDCVAESNL